MWTWFFRLGSPRWFYHGAGKWMPWVWALTFAGLTTGVIWGLFIAPPDYYQGELQRIMYVHVPAAYLSLKIYVIMAIRAAIGMIWGMKMAFVVSVCSAPIGAGFCYLALVTGAIWW